MVHFSPSDPKHYERITFDASDSSADEGIAEYQWEFGDGTTETTEWFEIDYVL